MKRARLLLVAAAAGLGVLAVSAGSAVAADPISDAEAKLGTTNLYVDPTATGFKLDQTKLAGSIPSGVKIAVLPSSAGSSASEIANQIGRNLDPNLKGLTVGVLLVSPSDYQIGAGSSAFCAGYANEKAKAADAANRDQLKSTHDVTDLLIDFATGVRDGPKANTSACGNGSTGGAAAPAKKDDSGGSVWPWVVGIGAVGAAGIGGLVWYRRRTKTQELELARSKVMPYYDRLASEVNTIDTKDNDVAQQAMADASERYTTAGTQLDTADSVEKIAQGRRTTLEGLYAARAARKALGLDEGAPLPPIADVRGDQLTEPQDVTVQGQTFQGYPAYTPGSPYYYGGGYGVPGGWYSTPFWETLLVASVLSGGLGGWGGGGYNYGYDSGYQSGYDAGRDSADNSGGNWGGGGGDFGGGGGDWGGGGGDFGGGGGGDSGGSW